MTLAKHIPGHGTGLLKPIAASARSFMTLTRAAASTIRRPWRAERSRPPQRSTMRPSRPPHQANLLFMVSKFPTQWLIGETPTADNFTAGGDQLTTVGFIWPTATATGIHNWVSVSGNPWISRTVFLRLLAPSAPSGSGIIKIRNVQHHAINIHAQVEHMLITSYGLSTNDV